MAKSLTEQQTATVTVLLQAGNTVKEIAKLANLDRNAVLAAARELDLDPPTKAQQRAKVLYGSSTDGGMTYQEVAATLQQENLRNDDGKKVHYLTISTWAANFGWRWGGSTSGDYAPARTGSAPARSKYTMRMSKSMAEKVNNADALSVAADTAWKELDSDRTRIVELAVIKGAAHAGVTDRAAVKKLLMKRHGGAIRSAVE